MKMINYLLAGLGYKGWIDAKISLFGFINSKVIIEASLLSGVITFIESAFGFSALFLYAYAGLIALEWLTGVKASYKRNEKHESRKLGRMLFKILIYSSIVIILNLFQKEANFPVIFSYEIDPFFWLYWMAIMIIIWQLFVSVLENLDELEFRFAGVLLKVINNKFYEKLGIKDESNNSK